MALAPGLKRKGGLFGSAPMQPPYSTPGIGDGMTASQQPQKPKFFGEGGVGRGIAGTIGDFLLQQSGMDPIYAPVMQQRQAMAYDQQQAEMRRRQGLEDWVAKQEWERNNPKPATPYRWESNDGSLLELGPDGQPRVVYKDPTPKINWVRADNGDGTFTMVPMGPNGPINLDGQGGAPAAPKGKLKPYGGQTATPSGNFR